MFDERGLHRATCVPALVVLSLVLLACPPKKNGPPHAGSEPVSVVEGEAEGEEEALLTGTGRPPKEVPIFLTYVGPDYPCVTAPEATIWRKADKKPKKARWWVDQEEVRRWWEIEPKEGTEDYLKPVPAITCADNYTTGKLKPELEEEEKELGELEWEYQVLVWECTDQGTRGPFLCESDPMLRIRD